MFKFMKKISLKTPKVEVAKTKWDQKGKKIT